MFSTGRTTVSGSDAGQLPGIETPPKRRREYRLRERPGGRPKKSRGYGLSWGWAAADRTQWGDGAGPVHDYLERAAAAGIG